MHLQYTLAPMQRPHARIAAELRAALVSSKRVAVRVALDSGPCWVTAVAMRPARRSTALRSTALRSAALCVEVELAGASLVLPVSRVLAIG